MNHNILLKTKIQAIYFQTTKDELGIVHATKKRQCKNYHSRSWGYFT